MSELKQFKLPDVGEGLTEADIVRWLVHPGDKITINQSIVEIETADVGTPIISVQVGGDGAAPADESAISTPPVDGAVEPGIHGSPAPKAERQAVLVGYGVKLGATKRRPRK